MTVRIHLDALLAQKRLSLVELSDRSGISVRHLEMLRDQKALAIRFKTIEALCLGLRIEPSELWTREENPRSEAD